MPAKGSEAKRTRRDRTEMEEIMFKLFERQPHWTLRQLIQETDQPEVGFFLTLNYCITIDGLFLILNSKLLYSYLSLFASFGK